MKGLIPQTNSTGDSAFRLATEVDEMLQLRAGGKLCPNPIQSIADCQPSSKHDFVGLPERPLGLLAHAVTLQTHFVHTPALGGTTAGHHGPRHILPGRRATT